jgi:hypothetical protein
MKYSKVKQGLSRSRYQWEEGEHKENVKERKYGGCILYSYMKIEK